MDKKTRRISLDIPIEIAKEVKIRSATRNISMKLWILRSIVRQIKEENKYL